MSCPITTGYSLGCRNSIGGIKAVYVGMYNDTAMTFTLGTASMIATIGGATVSFYTVSQRAQVGSYTQTLDQTTDKGTKYYTQTIEVTIENADNVISNWLDVLAQGIWRVLILDNMNQYWMLGTKNGAYVTAETGGAHKAYGDGNNEVITFTAMEPNRANLVSSAAALSVIS